MKVARIYFTTFSDKEFNRIVESLKGMFGDRVIVHRSVVLKEFRYVEILDFKDSIEEVEKIVKDVIGHGEYVKVDVVEVTKPKR